MEELCKIAAEKGFKTKTVSTHVTFNYYIGEGKNIMLNDMCDYLLLCEIQNWIGKEFKINIIVDIDSFAYDFSKVLYKVKIWQSSAENDYKEPEFFDFETYDEALKSGILETLKTTLDGE